MEIVYIECYQAVRIGGSAKNCIVREMGHTLSEYVTTHSLGVLVDGEILVPWDNISQAKIVPVVGTSVPGTVSGRSKKV